MKPLKPLVSVCCITYNQEKYVEETLQGFLSQKTTFPIEILIHDDASTDNTPHILKKYEEIDDRISVIYQTENKYSKGEKPFLNYLFPKVKGKYIAICEGDDYWIDPLKLQKQVDFMEKNTSYSLCGTKTQRFNESGGKGENTGKLYGEITLDEVLRQNQFGTCTVLLRSKFLEIPFFNNLNDFFGADWALWCFMLSKGPGYNINELTAVYNVHAGGVSSGRDKTSILRNKLENRILMIANFPDKKKIIKNYGLKIILHYFWKSALMQRQYATALARNRILVWRYIKF